MMRGIERWAWALLAAAVLSVLTVGIWAQQPAGGGGDAQGPTVTVPGQPPAVNPDRPATVAVQTQEVPSPAAPPHYVDQTIWALLVAQGYEYLKKCGWFNWITPSMAGRVKARIGFATAVLTAAGVHLAVNGSVFDGGTATLTWAGASWSVFKDIAFQWGAQQALYTNLVKETPAATVVIPSGAV